MPVDKLHLDILSERPVVRNDQPSEIDIAIDLISSRSVGLKPTNYSINLCVVIDRSGSMAGAKLDQAKKSCVDIYRSLNSNDLMTVLAFDEEVISVINPQTPRDSVTDRIMGLFEGGMTDLSKGWYLGLSELQTYTSSDHINRLILLSDGQANRGEKKPGVLGEESARARDQLGITTSTIGIGTDFQEDILAAIAHESGGRFWFIGEARIEDILKEEFSGALSVLLERPRIEVDLPPGVELARELNSLTKISSSYRLRPIKANDRFCFALRLRVDPDEVVGGNLEIRTRLFDGPAAVESSTKVLSLLPAEEYAASPEDSTVAMIVEQYLASVSDEQIAAEIDEGDMSGMLAMLQSQSDMMKELEKKLAGATATPLDEAMIREGQLRIEHQKRQLDHLRIEIGENEALLAVGRLIDLMRGLGLDQSALELLGVSRKVHHHRGNRKLDMHVRGGIDDWAAGHLLAQALEATDRLLKDFPDLKTEISTIREGLNERLESFSR
jgi:Ca-activated chloride channel family protein